MCTHAHVDAYAHVRRPRLLAGGVQQTACFLLQLCIHMCVVTHACLAAAAAAPDDAGTSTIAASDPLVHWVERTMTGAELGSGTPTSVYFDWETARLKLKSDDVHLDDDAPAVAVAPHIKVHGCMLPNVTALPFCDPTLAVADRARDLRSRLTRAEKLCLMDRAACAVPRLGLPQYNWGVEDLHGAGLEKTRASPLGCRFILFLLELEVMFFANPGTGPASSAWSRVTGLIAPLSFQR